VAFEILKRGLGRGFIPAFPLGLGAALADLFYLSLIYFGAINLITDNPRVQSAIFLLGSVLLILLGVVGFVNLKKGNQQKPHEITAEDVTRDMQKIVVDHETIYEKVFHFIKRLFLGFTMGFFNPTVVLLFITIMPPIFADILSRYKDENGYLFAVGFALGVIILFTLEAMFASLFKNLLNAKFYRILSICLNSLILLTAGYFLYKFIDMIQTFTH
jgi:threonine/homoserine/homoserine lactone efflux protein